MKNLEEKQLEIKRILSQFKIVNSVTCNHIKDGRLVRKLKKTVAILDTTNLFILVLLWLLHHAMLPPYVKNKIFQEIGEIRQGKDEGIKG